RLPSSAGVPATRERASGQAAMRADANHYGSTAAPPKAASKARKPSTRLRRAALAATCKFLSKTGPVVTIVPVSRAWVARSPRRLRLSRPRQPLRLVFGRRGPVRVAFALPARLSGRPPVPPEVAGFAPCEDKRTRRRRKAGPECRGSRQ